MATTLTSECNLLVIPFSAVTNFTTLADYCEHFAETIIECHDLALKMAPCGRLSTCLALLRPTLGEPIPPHLIDRFTVDVLPDVLPEFTPDADLLCDYCLALAQVLLGRSLLPETETTLTGLLCDLVWYFADGLKAPRWIRTTMTGPSCSPRPARAAATSTPPSATPPRCWPTATAATAAGSP